MCVEIIKVASEVLNFSRQRTLVNMRFLEPAIRMLTESPSKCMRNRSYGMGTDGKNLYYNPEYVLRAYQKEKGFVSRMYLHLVVHGIFRHFFVNRAKKMGSCMRYGNRIYHRKPETGLCRH